MVLRVADDGHSAAHLPDNIPLGYRLRRIVRTFCVNIRSDISDKLLNRRLIKYGNKVYDANPGDHLSTLGLRSEWATLALESSCLSIRVDPDN